MATKAYGVDYWYRHESDPDQSIRASCQMGSGADTESDVRNTIAQLITQGYRVQRVLMCATCPECLGAGRIGRAPKGIRKTKIASLPAWRLKWTNCSTCKGNGHVSEIEVPING